MRTAQGHAVLPKNPLVIFTFRRKTTLADSSRFVCTAENQFGQATKTINLVVQVFWLLTYYQKDNSLIFFTMYDISNQNLFCQEFLQKYQLLSLYYYNYIIKYIFKDQVISAAMHCKCGVYTEREMYLQCTQNFPEEYVSAIFYRSE